MHREFGYAEVRARGHSCTLLRGIEETRHTQKATACSTSG